VTKHVGIVACSAEGAALCYRTLCAEGPSLLGEHCRPEVSMHTHPLATYMVHIRKGDWASVADLMLSSAGKLAGAGADFLICPDNTVHEAFDLVVPRSPLPWLHIAAVVSDEAARRGRSRVGVLGTRYLMTGPVYPAALGAKGIEAIIPDARQRDWIDAAIFSELVNGVVRDETRVGFNEVIGALKSRGADAVVLGCTEIPLIVRPDEAPLPTLDSTRLLARAALRKAVDPDAAAG